MTRDHDPATMRHAIEFEGANDVTVTTSGRASLVGVTEYLEELVSDARYTPGMKVLIDNTELDMSSLTADDLKALAAFAVGLGERLGQPYVAHVSPSKAAFGLTRMVQLLANREEGNSRVFSTRQEARAWLASVA